jgi:hypothetical protein
MQCFFCQPDIQINCPNPIFLFRIQEANLFCIGII